MTKKKGEGSVWVSVGFGGNFVTDKKGCRRGKSKLCVDKIPEIPVCVLIGFGRPTRLQGLARCGIRPPRAVHRTIYGARVWEGIGPVRSTLE